MVLLDDDAKTEVGGGNEFIKHGRAEPMSNDLMYQCVLRRGEEKVIAWIEERGAKVGKYVELKEDHTFWKVETVWQPPRPAKDVKDTERKAHKGTRSFSDI
jgi:hypothetical protein